MSAVSQVYMSQKVLVLFTRLLLSVCIGLEELHVASQAGNRTSSISECREVAKGKTYIKTQVIYRTTLIIKSSTSQQPLLYPYTLSHILLQKLPKHPLTSNNQTRKSKIKKSKPNPTHAQRESLGGIKKICREPHFFPLLTPIDAWTQTTHVGDFR